MNLTVFGAAGAIGSRALTELLANGHTVTAAQVDDHAYVPRAPAISN